MCVVVKKKELGRCRYRQVGRYMCVRGGGMHGGRECAGKVKGMESQNQSLQAGGRQCSAVQEPGKVAGKVKGRHGDRYKKKRHKACRQKEMQAGKAGGSKVQAGKEERQWHGESSSRLMCAARRERGEAGACMRVQCARGRQPNVRRYACAGKIKPQPTNRARVCVCACAWCAGGR